MSSTNYSGTVLERLRKYELTRLCPLNTEFRARAWLNNFENKDQVVAAALLDRLTLFSDYAVNAMLRSALRQLAGRALDITETLARRKAGLARFLDSIIWFPLEGERPKPVDSGNYMCRKLRDILGVEENAFFNPADALEVVRPGSSIVLVDDFSGTGDQAVDTINRKYGGATIKGLAASSGVPIHVLLLAATKGAIQRLSAQGVAVASAHIITTNAHIQRQEPYPQLPPDISTADLTEFIARHSTQLRVPEYMEDPEQRAYGYGQLGLTIAFEHCVPDSTLPIYWAPGSAGWKPFKERK